MLASQMETEKSKVTVVAKRTPECCESRMRERAKGQPTAETVVL